MGHSRSPQTGFPYLHITTPVRLGQSPPQDDNIVAAYLAYNHFTPGLLATCVHIPSHSSSHTVYTYALDISGILFLRPRGSRGNRVQQELKNSGDLEWLPVE